VAASSESRPVPTWPCRDADHLLVTAAQMAELEDRLFASGLPVEALMEKAALAIARRLLQLAAGGATAVGTPVQPADPTAEGAALRGDLGGALGRHGALVLVGPGHNGGDGLVVARELQLAGVPVRIWSPFATRRPLTERHWRHALWLGIPTLQQPPEPDDPGLWIDALFGNGQRRPPGQEIESLLRRREERQPALLVALDQPTGICSDSGRLLGEVAARAGLTLAIGLIRRGLVQDAALHWVGRLERIELGLPATLLEVLPADQPLGLGGAGSGRGDSRSGPRPRARAAAGKYERGRLLVIAGSDRYPGAAHLALAGASSSGCGSLRAGVTRSVAAALCSTLPHVVPEGEPWSAAALERLDAVLVGPGLGPEGGESWEQLQRFGGVLVLDADGLQRISADWLRGRAGATWITPHAAEFAHLFPDLAQEPPLEAAAEAARRCGAAVLLKGAHTVVALADGRRWQLLRSCPAAARAGLGDVLAGYAAGLAARAAACGEPDGAVLALAALDHALAGCRAAARRGEGGASPQEVAKELGRAGA